MPNRGATLILSLLLLFAGTPSFADTDRLPMEFRVSEATVELVIQCPWNHRRTYELDGNGEFRFLDVARSEDPSVSESVITSEQTITPDYAGSIVGILLESSFPILPGTVPSYMFIARNGIVSGSKPLYSTGCSADIRLVIGGYRKSVHFEDVQHAPGRFVQALQVLSGENES